MKKMMAMLLALSLALALGGCKPSGEPEAATVETETSAEVAAESGGYVVQDLESDSESALKTQNGGFDEAQETTDEVEVQEDTFEDE